VGVVRAAGSMIMCRALAVPCWDPKACLCCCCCCCCRRRTSFDARLSGAAFDVRRMNGATEKDIDITSEKLSVAGSKSGENNCLSHCYPPDSLLLMLLLLLLLLLPPPHFF